MYSKEVIMTIHNPKSLIEAKKSSEREIQKKVMNNELETLQETWIW